MMPARSSELSVVSTRGRAAIPLEVSGGESYRPLSPRREIKPVPLIFQVLIALGTGTVKEKVCPVVSTVLAE